MNKIRQLIIQSVIAALTVLCLTTTANATTPIQTSLAPMLKKIMPAIVNLSVRGKILGGIPFQPQRFLPGNHSPSNLPGPLGRQSPLLPTPKFQNVGSGVIVDAKRGYIVTNAHVIHNADIITVSLSDGRHLMGKKIGADPASDIAVIQIKAKNLKAIPFVKDSNKVQIGDGVVAVGNPFGLQQTATSGVVSALNRHIGIEGYEDFIQTDAPINPGNSGGALLNLKGELIGINTAILSRTGASIGLGFAIPSNMVQGVMRQLIKYGKVQRGLLGVRVQNLTPALADALKIPGVKGALITTVEKGSAAEEAGLKAEDVIETINGKSIHGGDQVRSMIGVLREGSTVSLGIRRGHRSRTIRATIKDPKELEEKLLKMQSPLAGLQLVTYDQMDTRGRSVKGVQVLRVSDHSLAWFSGVRPGDVITALNRKTTPNVDTLVNTMQHESMPFLLKLQRFNSTIFLVVGDG